MASTRAVALQCYQDLASLYLSFPQSLVHPSSCSDKMAKVRMCSRKEVGDKYRRGNVCEAESSFFSPENNSSPGISTKSFHLRCQNRDVASSLFARESVEVSFLVLN